MVNSSPTDTDLNLCNNYIFLIYTYLFLNWKAKRQLQKICEFSFIYLYDLTQETPKDVKKRMCEKKQKLQRASSKKSRDSK